MSKEHANNQTELKQCKEYYMSSVNLRCTIKWIKGFIYPSVAAILYMQVVFNFKQRKILRLFLALPCNIIDVPGSSLSQGQEPHSWVSLQLEVTLLQKILFLMDYFRSCHVKNKHAINKWYTMHTGANMVETTYYILIWERARKRERKSEREQFIYIFTRLAITMVSTDGLEALVPSVNCNPLGGWPVVTSEQWPVHDTRQCRCIRYTRVFVQYG